MKLQEFCTYRTENGYIVTVERSTLPYYKFRALRASIEGKDVKLSEVWTEDGIAYHDDCGFNIVEQIA